MNQDQVKVKLLLLRKPDKDFEVVFSGKTSKKVNGLYKPETGEIVVHNRNFTNDNDLMYTAIHEFTHHLQFTTSPLPISSRTHTVAFWGHFHTLLKEAEEKQVYCNPFDAEDEFVQLTRQIKEKIVEVNGALMKELGRLLLKAQDLCEKYHTNFTDYLDRVLNLSRSSAKTAVKAHAMDLDSRIGFDNMQTLTRIQDAEQRNLAQEAFTQGMSPDWVKYRFAGNQPEADPLDLLLEEKIRTEKQIQHLRDKLIRLDERIEQCRREES